MSSIGIKLQRLARGWSQFQLAERAGISQSTVSRAERGLFVQAPELARIDAALELPELGQVGAQLELELELPMAPCGHRHRTTLAAERCALGLDKRGPLGARARRAWASAPTLPPTSQAPTAKPGGGASRG